MKNTIKYFGVCLISIMIGVCSTVLVIHYIPSKSTEKTVNEVNIHETNTIKSAIDKIYNAVLVVETYDARGTHIGTGTGFVYKKDEKSGYIMTNHHVIEGASSIKLINVLNEEVDAKLLGSDEYSDIAVLSMDASKVLSVASIGDSTQLELGDTLFTVGSPLGSKYMGTVTKGILSGENRQVTVTLKTGSFIMNVLQTDAAINPGNSGGPLLNINGEVIGVTSMKLVQDEIEGMGFAIPIELAMASISQLEKGEAIVRPVLGVQLIDLDNAYLLRNYQIQVPNDVKNGIAIVQVEEGSAASKSGLQKGDIITKIDDHTITETGQFRYVLYQYNIGDSITVHLMRDGKQKEVKIILTDSLGTE